MDVGAVLTGDDSTLPSVNKKKDLKSGGKLAWLAFEAHRARMEAFSGELKGLNIGVKGRETLDHGRGMQLPCPLCARGDEPVGGTFNDQTPAGKTSLPWELSGIGSSASGFDGAILGGCWVVVQV